MTQRQIDRWLRKRFSGVCWMVFAYFIFLNGVVLAAMAVDIVKQLVWSFAVRDFRFALDETALMENGWGYIVAAVIYIVILYAWKGGDYFRYTLFVREKKMTLFSFFALISICTGLQMVNSIWVTLLEMAMNAFDRSIIPMLESVSGSTPSISMFVYSGVVAPICEELLFRGHVQSSLRPYGRRFSILGASVLFALLHGNLIQTPYAFIMGLVFGYAASVYSLKWAIALHVFNNLILAEGLGRLTANMPVEAENIFYTVLFGTFLLISVVILLLKRREISAWRKGEWMDRRCVKCFFTCLGFLVFAAVMAVNTL